MNEPGALDERLQIRVIQSFDAYPVYDYMDGAMPMMGHGFGGILGWLLWIFIIAAIAYLIVSLSKRSGGQSAESPLDILKKRYARGDITKEEFENMKKDIESR